MRASRLCPFIFQWILCISFSIACLVHSRETFGSFFDFSLLFFVRKNRVSIPLSIISFISFVKPSFLPVLYVCIIKKVFWIFVWLLKMAGVGFFSLLCPRSLFDLGRARKGSGSVGDDRQRWKDFDLIGWRMGRRGRRGRWKSFFYPFQFLTQLQWKKAYERDESTKWR